MKPKSQVSAVPSKTKAEKVPLRWSRHLPLAIRIALSGKDEDGQTFTESTQTVGVDRRGARVITSHQIALGAEVAVENRAVGRTAMAKVVWRGDGASHGRPAEIVVELIEPSESVSIWGLKFPSRNEKAAPNASPRTQMSQPTETGEPARRVNTVAGPESGELIPATTSEGSDPPIQPELRADSRIEGADLSAELEGLTSSLGEETKRSLEISAAETAGDALAVLQDHAETLRRSADEAVSSVSLAAEKAAAEVRAAREETEASFRTSVEDYNRRLAELSASRIEDLQRRFESLFENFRRKMQTALDDLQQEGATKLGQSLQETVEDAKRRSADQLQQQVEGAWKSLTEELKVSVAPLVDEAGKRLADVTQSSVERVMRGAEAAAEEWRIQRDRVFEEQTVALGRSAESAAKSIQLASDEAFAKLKAVRQQMETALDTEADGFRRRLAETSAAEIERVQRQSDALLESFESRLLQNTLQEFQQKVAQQVADQIPRITRDLLECSANQLRRQADDAVGRLSEELKASRTTLVDDTREQIAALTGASLESLSREVRAVDEESRRQLAQAASQCANAALDSIRLATDEAVTGLQAAQGRVQASAEAHAEEYKKRLAELSICGIEELERKAGTLLGNFEGQLQGTLNDFQRRGTADLTNLLREVAERLQHGCAEQLQRQAADALTASNEELQASKTALVDATGEQIAAIVQASLESFSVRVRATEEEARTALDQTASRCTRAALDSITLAADEGLAGLQAAQAKVEASIDARTEECERRLTKLATSGCEDFELMARGRLETFRDELQSTLDDFHHRGTTELTDRFQRFAEGLQQRGVEELQKQSDNTLKSLSDELRTSGTRLVDEAKLRLADTARASLESVIQEVKATTEESRAELAQTVSKSAREAMDCISLAGEESVAGLQAAQEKAEASFKNEAERERKLLADLSASGIEELQHTADSVLHGFSQSLKEKARATFEEAGGQLQGTLQQLAESSLRESESKHEGLVKKQRRIFQDNIDFAAQATLERLTRRLTGLEQEQRGSVVSKLALGLVALVPTILFVCLSTRPVMRLRLDPPGEFLAAIDDAAPERRATEERVARAYWDWAYLHLPHKYSFAAQLPEDPPMEMEVEGKDFPTGLEAEFTKRRYWRKLRQVWTMPQAWEKSSPWDHK